MTQPKILDDGCVKLVSIQKTHLILAIVFMLGSPVVSGIASYRTAVQQANTAVMDKKIADYATMNESKFVRKEEFRPMERKISRIAEDVAEIKGFLKRGR